MTKTPEEGERIEKQPEEHQQSLQEPQGQNQPAEDDLKRVTVVRTNIFLEKEYGFV